MQRFKNDIIQQEYEPELNNLETRFNVCVMFTHLGMQHR